MAGTCRTTCVTTWPLGTTPRLRGCSPQLEWRDSDEYGPISGANAVLTYRTAYGYPWRWAILAEFFWRWEHTRLPGHLWAYRMRKTCERRGSRA